MNWTSIMLSEKRLDKKFYINMIPFIWHPQKTKNYGTEIRSVNARGVRWGNWLQSATRNLFGAMEKYCILIIVPYAFVKTQGPELNKRGIFTTYKLFLNKQNFKKFRFKNIYIQSKCTNLQCSYWRSHLVSIFSS